MTPRLPTIEILDPAMVAILRRKTPAEKLAQAFDMWDFAIGMVRAVIRRDHPEWTGEQIERESFRRIRGSEMP